MFATLHTVEKFPSYQVAKALNIAAGPSQYYAVLLFFQYYEAVSKFEVENNLSTMIKKIRDE